eukprot:9345252-Alexandrium_andersonii.AAC.1
MLGVAGFCAAGPCAGLVTSTPMWAFRLLIGCCFQGAVSGGALLHATGQDAILILEVEACTLKDRCVLYFRLRPRTSMRGRGCQRTQWPARCSDLRGL